MACAVTADYVASHGPLTPSVAAQVFEQVSRCIEAAHENQLAHRALSPFSIAVEPGRGPGQLRAQVMDFRLARRVASLGRATNHGTAATISDHEYVALWAWLSPEGMEAQDGPGGPGEDIWSLGLLAYWLFTGQHYFLPPRQEVAPLALLREVAHGAAVPASARARDQGFTDALVAGFDSWFARCLMPAPEARFASAREARREFMALWASAESRREPQPAPVARAQPPRPATLPLATPTAIGKLDRVVSFIWAVAGGALLLCLAVLLLFGAQTCSR